MLLGRFLKSTSGGAAPFLALSLVPLMGFTGAAIDYSRGNAVKVAMQAALDSTGLILSKDAQNLSTGALASRIDSVFKAQFNRPEAHNVSVSYVFNAPQQGNFSLKLTGSATVPTHFATLIGTSELTVSATAEVIWGIKRLNLALALDNTGSMASSGKMTALKAAAHNLLNTLQAAAKKPDDVKVSIIPFATDVNVGTATRTSPGSTGSNGTTPTGHARTTITKPRPPATMRAGHGPWQATTPGTVAYGIATRTMTCRIRRPLPRRRPSSALTRPPTARPL